jgi:GAF domain-containing protein
VFDAILEKAIQLCGSHMGTAGIFEGDTFRFVAVRAGNPEAEKWLLDRGSFHPHPGGPLSRLSEGKIVETPDMRESAGYRNRRPWQTQLVEKIGVRSTFAVPLMKDGRAIGALGIYRAEVRQFSQKEIDLVRTFADQAVIAIENVRLFNEIQNKSRQLEVANRHKSEFLANTVARAAHATERGDRFLGASAAGYGRRVERKARRVHQLRPYLRQPSAFAHQRHPRSL